MDTSSNSNPKNDNVITLDETTAIIIDNPKRKKGYRAQDAFAETPNTRDFARESLKLQLCLVLRTITFQ